MHYLIDTHILLWLLYEPKQLNKKIKTILEDSENEIYISTISFYEIAIKKSINKLNLQISQTEILNALDILNFTVIDLKAEHSIAYEKLKLHEMHKDPFDKMLISVAIYEQFIFITNDDNLKKYCKMLKTKVL